MYIPSKVLWCFVLLFVASSSETQENSTNGDNQSDSSTVQYDLFVNSMKYRNNKIKSTRCISSESFIKNDNKMEYGSYINSTKNDRKDDDSKWQCESRRSIIKDCKEGNQISMESAANSIGINNSIKEIKNFSRIEKESDSTSYENRNCNKNNKIPESIKIVSHKMCHNITCVQLCCPARHFMMITGKCVANESGTYHLPKICKYKDCPDDPVFSVTFHDPCLSQELEKSMLHKNKYHFLSNGSLHQSSGKLISPTSYCLASFNLKIYEVMVCNNQKMYRKRLYPIYVSACLLVSLPFLLVTFVVYSILPELQNMHGYTLRAYIASLFIAYIIMYCGQQVSELQPVNDKRCCIILAYILNFSFLSTFFWSNVICFDIWWKFRGLRSYQTSMWQEKKKFLMYSIYAWGIPLILNIICAIADNVVEISKDLKPQICTKKFWFGGNWAKTIYFHIPMSATIIINIGFFIAIALSIRYQNVRAAKQLRQSESKCHNENKQRFKMYLKLFIVMGISWIIEILAWLINSVPSYIWYLANMLNSLQGLIIFFIFVRTNKIKQQLLKRYGGQNSGLFGKSSMYNDRISSSITTTSTLGTGPMQEMDSINQQQVSQRLNLAHSTET
ncbi:G-protein coupled receptor Mth2 [Solenopsis invicta]|uniref:G-protein coupled receptor Mth2 n=1 Tax=Solenopsis invicta TaxID=13686 RepID=UPI000596057F|nr:G-protein coupled receptor Mth2 [Solenopsis invicta]XP_011175315.1 G-protein coupled receptor Mth2 [Solenopsis invicta]